MLTRALYLEWQTDLQPAGIVAAFVRTDRQHQNADVVGRALIDRRSGPRCKSACARVVGVQLLPDQLTHQLRHVQRLAGALARGGKSVGEYYHSCPRRERQLVDDGFGAALHADGLRRLVEDLKLAVQGSPASGNGCCATAPACFDSRSTETMLSVADTLPERWVYR